MKSKSYAVIALLMLMVTLPAVSQEKGKKEERREDKIRFELSDHQAFELDGFKVTLGKAIEMVLVKNRDTLTGSYEVAMADSSYQIYQKKYSTFLNMEGGVKHQKYPEAMNWSMVGKDQRAWDVSAAVARMFASGTTLSAGLRHERAKTSYQSMAIPGLGEIPPFGDPDYHRPIMFVKLQQELLKNAFGYSERRVEDILKNAGKMKRDAIIFQLSGLVVGVVVDYWTVVIQRSALDNAELQLKETRRVRNIIASNVRLGLAESFDLNYYNALVASSEAKTVNVRQNYQDAVRKLLRTLNMDEKTRLSGTAYFVTNIKDVNEEEALKTAYRKRADYQNALMDLKNAKMAVDIYSNDSLPSLMAEFDLSSMGQRKEYGEAYSESGSLTYPAWEARLKMTYPLDDREQKTNLRDARFKFEQARLQVDKYRRLVRDDIISSIEHIESYYKLYQKMKEARGQAEKYYSRLVASLRRGRFSADVVKNGLDAMVESRQRELEALVQYNITLLQFQLVRNDLFETYKINVDKYIPRDRK